MTVDRPAIRIDALLISLLAYAAASLFHHVHNAEFLSRYPNLPASLTRGLVYAAWLAVTAVGVTGYVLERKGYRRGGLAMLGVYGLLGLYGLAHYNVAPWSAHTLTMNLTITLEVATAIVLLITVSGLMLRRFREARLP
jgi:hypothetical protein